MNKSKVALVGCDTYDEAQVDKAVEAGVDLLGGVTHFASLGERIVLKPNVLIGSHPDKCVTTHPAVFKAAGRLLQKAGATVYYGDSPCFGGIGRNMKKSHLKQAAEEMGIEQADFADGKSVSHKEGLLIKSFVIANGVLESDGIVSLPKIKTHGLTRYTGAIKNQFGCIPGLLKSQYHLKLPDPYDFATMLVDLTALVKPRLYIMDGIVGMDGNGPRGGNPKKLGVMLFSTDPVALDSVVCKIIDLHPEIVPTSKPGEESGLGTYHYENIEVVGANIEEFIARDFHVARRPPVARKSGRVKSFMRDRICPRPVINKEKCTNCGICVEMCPVAPKAVDWHTGDKSGTPTHKYGRCIRCYCCQEMCSEGAVSIGNTLLGRIFFPLK
ncbi:MAG TPA: DUF362 domain-containing protein [Dehalococcoidia bacterium]|nr:DUF362 domain-containing protein [Dehalococcoidia bacterium]